MRSAVKLVRQPSLEVYVNVTANKRLIFKYCLTDFNEIFINIMTLLSLP